MKSHPARRLARRGDGKHYLFKAPQLADSQTIKHDLAPGVDCLYNGYFVAPPSVVRMVDNELIGPYDASYEWDVPPWECELPEFPEWLVKHAVIPKTVPAPDADDYETEDDYARERAEAKLRKRGGALGSFAACNLILDEGIRNWDIAKRLLLDAYNPLRNNGAKSEEELLGKFNNAILYRQNPIGSANAVAAYRDVDISKFPPLEATESTPNWSLPETFGDPILFGEIETPEISSDFLPPWVRNFVDALAAQTQTSIGPPAILVLAVMAASLQKRFKVSPYGDGYTEPLSLGHW